MIKIQNSCSEMKRKYERIGLSISKVRRLGIELDDLNIPFNIEILWFTEIPTKIVMDSTKLDELKILNDINWLEVDISLEVSTNYPRILE